MVINPVMKSSTLHRSNLTKERMSMLENVKFQAVKRVSNDANQFLRTSKNPELDVLYRSFMKNVTAGSNASGNISNSSKIKIKVKAKTDGVYLSIGVIGGLIFLIIVSLVVWISSIPAKKNDIPEPPKTSAGLEVLSDTKETVELNRKEQYTIKSGDTLDKITYRFYGKYDAKKIDEIKKLNNIKDPGNLQIGQVLIIPVDK